MTMMYFINKQIGHKFGKKAIAPQPAKEEVEAFVIE
jgi:hypothetical protein